MGNALKRRLHQARFQSPYQEAVLNLLVASSHLRDLIDRVCSRHQITVGQYNVLRILRGVHPSGYSRCEIARRLVDRAPDVTRLIDRLEHQKLVERGRSDEDRRLSITRITRAGLDLLERMQPGIDETHQALAARLSANDARELSRICELIYDDAD